MNSQAAFEWDEAKNKANIGKHGISFETAKRIFERAVLTQRDERRDYGESRHVSIGEVEKAFIVVAYTWREGRMRLISARPASQKERQAYDERIRKASVGSGDKADE